MLEDIRDVSQSYKIVNRREARYKIFDHIKQRQSEWKGALKDTRSMDKCLYKVFKTIVTDIYQDLPPLGESDSEVSHFIPEHRNFAEVTKLSDYINKTSLKSTLKEIINLMNNQTFLVEYQKKYDPMTTCMDV